MKYICAVRLFEQDKRTESINKIINKTGISVSELKDKDLVKYVNLIGSFVVTGSLLKGLDDKYGIYFIFNDLTIRVEGMYSFLFTCSQFM